MGSTTTVPPEAVAVMRILRMHFVESLAAVYLHGSAVGRGLRPDSDVDLLAVIRHPMDREIRSRLIHDLMEVSGYPGSALARPVELMIFLSSDLTVTAYPVRCEFLYGEWLRSAFAAGEPSRPVCDPELTLAMAQARQEAKALAGPDVRELLPDIPQADLRRAIGDALPMLLASLEGDERNVLLTLARMWRTATHGDFVSKDVAAGWASGRLQGEAAGVLAQAREAYLGIQKDDWTGRRREVCRTVDLLQECVAKALGPDRR